MFSFWTCLLYLCIYCFFNAVGRWDSQVGGFKRAVVTPLVGWLGMMFCLLIVFVRERLWNNVVFIWYHILVNVHQVSPWILSSFFGNFMKHFLFFLMLLVWNSRNISFFKLLLVWTSYIRGKLIRGWAYLSAKSSICYLLLSPFVCHWRWVILNIMICVGLMFKTIIQCHHLPNAQDNISSFNLFGFLCIMYQCRVFFDFVITLGLGLPHPSITSFLNVCAHIPSIL